MKKPNETCGLINTRNAIRLAGLVFFLLGVRWWAAPTASGSPATNNPEFIDLSLLVADGLPTTFPGPFPPFQMNPYLRIGKLSDYNSEIITTDEHTGTQFDAPTHSVAPPDSGLPNAGPMGLVSSEKVPAWQFVGEACVIDVRRFRDTAQNGHSALIPKEVVIEWEKQHRPLGPGDVALFRSDYTDKYYVPYPEGRRFAADPIEGSVPAWPDPDPECMEYLASRKVMTLGIDSASMGPIPGDIGEETHYAGLKHGMIWTEGATGLGKLPATGAFYCTIGPKQAKGVGTVARAFAITGSPLAEWLIQAARKKSVIDLSSLLDANLPVFWPGVGMGRARYPYLRNPMPPFGRNLHTMDSHAGTHLVPPAYSLPAPGFDNTKYSPTTQKWLSEYEKRYGPRGTSTITTEKVALSQTSGWARVIDVQHLMGKVPKEKWPASPEITIADVKKYESEHGALKPGEIVIFHSGYTDRYCTAFPEGEACMSTPLNAKSEGWPAPGPDVIRYLAGKGIRCVATDGPTLGGADPKRALMTYWALGSKGMVGVEYLMNAGQIPAKAYFIFAATKIRGCHGGPGRAIALY